MLIDAIVTIIIILLLIWVKREFSKHEKIIAEHKESKAVSKEYWQQEYHWHEQVESAESNTQKCGVSWCDVYDMTPWKSQCSYEGGTGKCGAEAGYETREMMDKSKVAKMDMESFRQLKAAEFERDQWKAIANNAREDAEKWCNVAGIMHQYLVEGNPEGAVQAYERAAW